SIAKPIAARNAVVGSFGSTQRKPESPTTSPPRSSPTMTGTSTRPLAERSGPASPASTITERIPKVILRKSGAWNTPGVHEDQLAAYDEALARLGDPSDADLRLEVATLLGNKAYTLDALGRFEESAATYAELAERFETTDDPALRVEASRG